MLGVCLLYGRLPDLLAFLKFQSRATAGLAAGGLGGAVMDDDVGQRIFVGCQHDGQRGNDGHGSMTNG